MKLFIKFPPQTESENLLVVGCAMDVTEIKSYKVLFAMLEEFAVSNATLMSSVKDNHFNEFIFYVGKDIKFTNENFTQIRGKRF